MKNCFNCGKETDSSLYGFAVCPGCESNLKLMTRETVKKHYSENPEFKKEAISKLTFLEKDYARKKIELLHILEQIKKLEQ